MENPQSLKEDEVLASLGSSIHGLSREEARMRLERHGKNDIPEKKSRSPVFVFLKQFNNLMIYILLVAALISFVLGHLVDLYVILFVVLVNAVIGFVQERKAETAIQALKNMIVPHAKVYRGDLLQIDARELVPGDVVLLEEGDRVPADCRLLEIKNFRTVEASLTGESFPVDKDLRVLLEKTPLADRKNMVFMGTFIAGGRAKAVVVYTGMETAIGNVARDIESIKRTRSHFKQKTDRLAKQMAGLACLGAFVAFFIGFFVRGMGFMEIFMFTIASLVSAIPEGLPAVMAVVLALGAFRMAKRNAIVRTLTATETLGIVDTIATDKTGTLTENTMTVKKVFIPGEEELDVGGYGWEPEGGFSQMGKAVFPLENPRLSKLFHIASVCNSSRIVKKETDGYKIIGDPTEAALIVLARKAGLEKEVLETSEKKIDDLPFNPELKYRASLSVLVEKNNEKEIYVVGAPEALLERSGVILTKELKEEQGTESRKEILARVDKLTGKAMRVLGLAYKKVPQSTSNLSEDLVNGLTFVGLVGMMDPPRPEVKGAIEKAKKAGIRIIMTTGDHRGTAVAIAKEIGLVEKESSFPIALTEEELLELSEDEFQDTVSNVPVFARLTPGMKLRIAEALQKQGHVVAMTGDGVNDAPALKKSDIGISMGIIGTDVARESSEIVLADDNFASIVNAVEEGRIVFSNIRKASYFLITTNFAEQVTFISALLLNPSFPLILLPTQILWLNLVTDGVTGLSLSAEPGHGGVLNYPPRKSQEEILSRDIFPFLVLMCLIMVFATLAVFSFFLPYGLDKARTAAFTVLSFTQLFNLLNMRSLGKSIFRIGFLSNRYSAMALAVSTALLMAVIYVPLFQKVFQFTSLTSSEFIGIAALSSTVLLAGEAYKFMKSAGFFSFKPFHRPGKNSSAKEGNKAVENAGV